MANGGLVWRSVLTFFYFLAFCCSVAILGIYSYFLAELSKYNAPQGTSLKAVEGLAGAALVFTIFALVLSCILGGKRIFAILGIILSILFCAAMVAIAILVRHATNSCSGSVVQTPVGTGNPGSPAPGVPNLALACRLNKAVFALAIIGAFVFLICAVLQYLTMQYHRVEKKYSRSSDNGHTNRSGTKFWKRKQGPKTSRHAYGKHDEERNLGNGTRDPHMMTEKTEPNDRHMDRSRNRENRGATNDTHTTIASATDNYNNMGAAGYTGHNYNDNRVNYEHQRQDMDDVAGGHEYGQGHGNKLQQSYGNDSRGYSGQSGYRGQQYYQDQRDYRGQQGPHGQQGYQDQPAYQSQRVARY